MSSKDSVEAGPDQMLAQYPGDPRHPDHDAFLLELGHATLAASMLAGIAFDILRVHRNALSADLYNDPLGRLEKRLRQFPPDGLPGVEEFMTQLASARTRRNDLLHALPVRHGLHRRRKEDPGFVRNFFTVEDLRAVRDERRSRHQKVVGKVGGPDRMIISF